MAKQKQFGAEPFFDLQPDYKFSHNGYGLMQLSCTYAIDTEDAGISSQYLYRGVPFVKGNGKLTSALDQYSWTCIKAEESGRDGNIAYITAHYAAIQNGSFTETEASITSSVVSEAIESHPNFSKVQVRGIGDGKTPLGGKWINQLPPSVSNQGENPYRAVWQRNLNVTVGTQTFSFFGFAATDSNEKANRKAGVKSWMRPTFTMRLTAYTDNADEAASTCSYIGFVTSKKIGNCLTIPEIYNGIGESGLKIDLSDVSPKSQQGARDWLIVGANMEVFGGIYKVTADLLLSGVLGWDQDIYPKLTGDGYVNTAP